VKSLKRLKHETCQPHGSVFCVKVIMLQEVLMKGAVVFVLEQAQQVWVGLTTNSEINTNTDRVYRTQLNKVHPS